MGEGPLPILLFHPGKQHSPQTALALQRIGRLRAYVTSIFHDPRRFPYLLERIPGRIGRTLHREFSRFAHPEIDPQLVRTGGTLEWLERLALRAGAVNLSMRLDRLGNRHFAQRLKAEIGSSAPFALWGYNGSSVEAFRMAKHHGRFCILDRTIGDYRYFNRVMAAQAALYPQFFGLADRPVPQHQIAQDDEEYLLADRIVVGSDFCRQTLLDHSPVPGLSDKVVVLPYCANNHDFAASPASAEIGEDEPIRFLFAGRITPRKGIHLLLEAFSRLAPGAATLTLLGKMLIPQAAFAPHAARVRHIDSVAPHDVTAVMKQHHVLVLPSFFEGSAITLLEGLSSGLGIIQSPQAGRGATERTGIVLAENTVDNLHAALLRAVDNKDQVRSWRSHAFAESNLLSFDAYARNVQSLLGSI